MGKNSSRTSCPSHLATPKKNDSQDEHDHKVCPTALRLP